MLKQLIAIVVLSMGVIVSMPYVQHALQFVLSAHDWIADILTNVFSGGEAGNLIRELIALLAIPLGVAMIPAIVYWLAKRSWFPYFMEFLWITWLAQTAALIILYKVAA